MVNVADGGQRGTVGSSIWTSDPVRFSQHVHAHLVGVKPTLRASNKQLLVLNCSRSTILPQLLSMQSAGRSGR
jgi:hypothetical protein